MLLLAPFSGALAAVCHCELDWAGADEMAPFSCCGETQHCCYEHKEQSFGPPLLADLNQSSRADFQAAVRQAVDLLPAPVVSVALKQNFVHAADPPDTGQRERCFLQSWLI